MNEVKVCFKILVCNSRFAHNIVIFNQTLKISQDIVGVTEHFIYIDRPFEKSENEEEKTKKKICNFFNIGLFGV